MNSVVRIIALLLLTYQPTASAGNRQYRNLGNPVEYCFHFSQSKVIEVLKDPQRQLTPPPEPLHGSFRERNGYVFSFGTFDQYTKRYWNGKREREDEISPPEAGRIGTIEADFTVRVASRALNETVVSVDVKSFQQQVGRRYQLFPHMQKVGRMVSVKSDTYYEYLFLLRLGELLGETGMPPIKGSAD
jgi:hypothetical protein